ncbi:hypothetical protein L0244_29510 [bacterium]|nr:hypothetical protein [bacterium]
MSGARLLGGNFICKRLLAREGLAGILQDSSGIEVVGQAGDGAEALKLTVDKSGCCCFRLHDANFRWASSH